MIAICGSQLLTGSWLPKCRVHRMPLIWWLYLVRPQLCELRCLLLTANWVGLWDTGHAILTHTAEVWITGMPIDLIYGGNNYDTAWTTGGKHEQPMGAQNPLEICLVDKALENGMKGGEPGLMLSGQEDLKPLETKVRGEVCQSLTFTQVRFSVRRRTHPRSCLGIKVVVCAPEVPMPWAKDFNLGLKPMCWFLTTPPKLKMGRVTLMVGWTERRQKTAYWRCEAQELQCWTGWSKKAKEHAMHEQRPWLHGSSLETGGPAVDRQSWVWLVPPPLGTKEQKGEGKEGKIAPLLYIIVCKLGGKSSSSMSLRWEDGKGNNIHGHKGATLPLAWNTGCPWPSCFFPLSCS